MESLRLNPVPLGRVNLALPAPTLAITNEEEQPEIRKQSQRKGSRFEVVKAPDTLETSSASAAEGASSNNKQEDARPKSEPAPVLSSSPDIVISPSSDTDDVNQTVNYINITYISFD